MHLSDRSYVIRPMVRYVDQDRAVVEVSVAPAEPARMLHANGAAAGRLDVLIHIAGMDGFLDEQIVPLKLDDHGGVARFEVVQPERWWPAGMGEQGLYELAITLLQDEHALGEHRTILGLTSVRQGDTHDAAFIVNGELCRIESIVSVDQTDESRMLPVTGNSLLVVRDHYGTDVLYDAADRAGILAVQCIPIDPQGDPQREVAEQIARLAGHPSLAGWYVGHLGRLSDALGAWIRRLDPTRAVLRQMPGQPV